MPRSGAPSDENTRCVRAKVTDHRGAGVNLQLMHALVRPTVRPRAGSLGAAKIAPRLKRSQSAPFFRYSFTSSIFPQRQAQPSGVAAVIHGAALQFARGENSRRKVPNVVDVSTEIAHDRIHPPYAQTPVANSMPR
jgi:hypothetical protein